MKAAFPYWENRIAPVFDVAREIILVETAPGREVREVRETLPADLPVQKVLRLVELGVDALICGAISRPLHEMVLGYGIRVIPFVAGELREVIRAWLDEDLDKEAFHMPGCWGRGRRRGGRGRAGAYREGTFMQGTRLGGMGAGGGRGQGRGGQRGGRGGGAGGAGSGGSCVCPQCGHREPHKRGTPCFEKKCPQCGIEMMRD